MARKAYKIDDGWYQSENLRLCLIHSDTRWFKTKHGSWIRSNTGSTDSYINKFGNKIILTEHSKQRLYERSGVGIGTLKQALDNRNIKWLKRYDNGKSLLHFGRVKYQYTLVLNRIGEDTWVASTILLAKSNIENTYDR